MMILDVALWMTKEGVAKSSNQMIERHPTFSGTGSAV